MADVREISSCKNCPFVYHERGNEFIDDYYVCTRTYSSMRENAHCVVIPPSDCPLRIAPIEIHYVLKLAEDT